MQWQVHGERDIYRSEWVSLSLVDVEIPGVRRFEHHAVGAGDAGSVVLTDDEGRVLVMWRHRFLHDRWGWEIPAGIIDDGETPEEGARRECIEETGWAPGPLEPVYRFAPVAGLSRQTFWVFRGRALERVGEPGPEEASRMEWMTPAEVRQALDDNLVLDCMSVIGLMEHLRTVGA
jgi:8-oxo-dGTP pyrophosphatase MutT (NUDIX family)